MSQTGAETAAESTSADAATASGGVLDRYNPFKWTIRAFQAGGLNEWEEAALDALFATVLLVIALGVANVI